MSGKVRKFYWPWRDLNTQPSDLESDALPLRHRVYSYVGNKVFHSSPIKFASTFSLHAKEPLTGLEPAIPGFLNCLLKHLGGRCLIHWATVAGWCQGLPNILWQMQHSDHPLHDKFVFLRSGKRLMSPKQRTSRYANTFYHQVLKTTITSLQII